MLSERRLQVCLLIPFRIEFVVWEFVGPLLQPRRPLALLVGLIVMALSVSAFVAVLIVIKRLHQFPRSRTWQNISCFTLGTVASVPFLMLLAAVLYWSPIGDLIRGDEACKGHIIGAR